jgi:hypothetical protein
VEEVRGCIHPFPNYRARRMRHIPLAISTPSPENFTFMTFHEMNGSKCVFRSSRALCGTLWLR